MKHIKKILLTITAFALVLSLSGCYWKGNTKHHSEQLILNALEEKYNEKFFIREIAVRSSYPGRPLAAYCSPKDDEELIFEVDYYEISGLHDTYIQSVVRREMKDVFDTVLSEHFEDYAVGIYIYGTTPSYDSGITNADDASIKSYTEAIPDDNFSVVWIALNKDDFIDGKFDVQEILKTIVTNLNMANMVIECYYVAEEIIDDCNAEIEDGFVKVSDMDGILSTQRPIYRYQYNGISNELTKVKTFE